MSADGDDDDAQLKQLRAVWVSMREEDPPESGLAALMAAARDKADEMKSDAADAAKPGWWQRVLAAFRRPPVLALASVAVLVGGALVIANRSDEVNKPQVAGRAPQAELMDGIAKDVMTEPPPAPTPTHAPAPAQEMPYADPARPADVPDVEKAVTKPEPPKRAKLATGSAGKGSPPGGLVAGRDDAAKTPAKMSPPPPRDEEAKAKTVDAIDLDGAEGGVAAGETSAPVTRGPRKKDATPQAPQAQTPTVQPTDDVAKANTAKPNIGQLIAQCESAAARNDCGAVKALAARIKSGDAAAYNQRVVKNASIARCLEITVSE